MSRLGVMTIGAGLLACSSLALAAQRAGVVMPDSIEVQGKSLTLNGIGIRKATALKVKVYVAALYVPTRTSNPAQVLALSGPTVMQLRFVRDVGRDDINKAWSEGFEKNAGPSLRQLQPRIAQLEAAMPDLKTGDVMAFTYVPNEGVGVSVNGQLRATIRGADFARSFFSIWFGAHPPNEELKQGLLGLQP